MSDRDAKRAGPRPAGELADVERAGPRLVGGLADAALTRDPARVAAVDGDVALGYGELERRTNALALALAERGLRPGERVALLLGTGIPFLLSYLAIAKAGGVAVPIGTRLSASEIDFLLRHSDSREVIYGAAHAPQLAGIAGPRRIVVGGADAGAQAFAPLLERAPAQRPLACRTPDDDAAIFYTSGTTGSPKGVRLTHRNVTHCAQITREAYRTSAADVGLCQLPLSHVTVHFMPFPLLVAGGTVVLDDGFDAGRALELMARHGATQLISVTSTALLIAKHAESLGGHAQLRTLRKLFTGGSHVPPELERAWRVLAPNATIVNCYGMTEMASSVARMDPDEMALRPGSVGLPYRGVEVRIGDGGLPPGAAGEICLRSPSRMAGYWANPEATAASIVDGWLRTGDVGHLDDDGYLHLVGRRAWRLKRGGETIFPSEVEEVIVALPGVREALVIGRRDDVMGDRLVALVAPQPGVELGAEELVERCRPHLADFKLPEYVCVLPDGLPKNNVGKVDVAGLTRMVEQGALPLVDLRRGGVRGGERWRAPPALRGVRLSGERA